MMSDTQAGGTLNGDRVTFAKICFDMVTIRPCKVYGQRGKTVAGDTAALTMSAELEPSYRAGGRLRPINATETHGVKKLDLKAEQGRKHSEQLIRYAPFFNSVMGLH